MFEPFALQRDPEELVTRYMEDPRPELKDSILSAFANIVERTARKYSGMEPFEDLCQVGFIGLLNALNKFDPDAGVRFSTYATYLISGEMKHYLRDKSQVIRQPAWMQELRTKVNRCANMLQQTLGRVPTEREIADELGISESSVTDVFASQELLKLTSLDATPQSDEDSDSDVDKLDAAEFCPEQLSVEERLVLEGAMSQLRDLEKQVLIHFHFDAMNQTEIATKLGISNNYVSHILRQSLAKLRKILSAEAERDRVLKREAEVVDYDVIDDQVGAYTDAYLRNRVSEEVHRASCEGSAVGLVLINFRGLDSLKKFYGASSVTDFLADAAEFIRGNVRRLDVVCRYEATGFGVLLPATGSDTLIVRQRLFCKVAEWMAGRFGQNGSIKVEIGYACFPDKARNGLELLEAAVPKPMCDMPEAA